MPLGGAFFAEAESLFEPGMGTEAVGLQLYTLARMLRPRNALEVGLGYTTAFLAQGLADARAEFEADRALLGAEGDASTRRGLLRPDMYAQDYAPVLHAIDDFSVEGSSAPRVLDGLKRLGLDGLVRVHQGDFRGHSSRFEAADLPFDLVWLDAGGPREYVEFLREYWPLVSPEDGLLVLHFTYWALPVQHQGQTLHAVMASPVITELKRQQAAAGETAGFEVLSLNEPHKFRQGSVTLIRKLAPASRGRPGRFADDMRRITGKDWPDFPRLEE